MKIMIAIIGICAVAMLLWYVYARRNFGGIKGDLYTILIRTQIFFYTLYRINRIIKTK